MTFLEKKNLIYKRVYRRLYYQREKSNYIYKSVLKNKNIVELLGISLEDYVNYIESKLSPEMCFKKGNFDIDHVFPLYRSMSPQEYLSRWNYKNTMPLSSDENRNKSWKYPYEKNIKKKILILRKHT